MEDCTFPHWINCWTLGIVVLCDMQTLNYAQIVHANHEWKQITQTLTSGLVLKVVYSYLIEVAWLTSYTVYPV